MRAMKRVQAAIAASLAMGLALVAAPAFAAPGDPVVTIANTTFSSGNWGAGVEFTVTDIPVDAEDVTLIVGADYAQGRGTVGTMAGVQQAGGTTYTGSVIPEESPVMPDADGYPEYIAFVSYTVAGEYRSTDPIALTITEGMSVTGPKTATVAQLAAGVALQFKGFAPDETLEGDIEYFNLDANAWEPIGVFSATVGPDGSGGGTLSVTGATADDLFRVIAFGASGSVTYYVTAIADATTPATPTPTTPAKPVRVETGL